jgi:hypothetical protein
MSPLSAGLDPSRARPLRPSSRKANGDDRDGRSGATGHGGQAFQAKPSGAIESEVAFRMI